MKRKVGRPKGSKNKNSQALKTRINLFIERNFDAIQDEYDSLPPKDKLTFIKDLLPFVVAKMTTTDATVRIEDKLKELDDNDLIGLAQAMLEDDGEEI